MFWKHYIFFSYFSEMDSVTNDILRDNAPVAIGGIYQTTDLLSNFDTTFPHMEDCASFISLTSIALPK